RSGRVERGGRPRAAPPPPPAPGGAAGGAPPPPRQPPYAARAHPKRRVWRLHPGTRARQKKPRTGGGARRCHEAAALRLFAVSGIVLVVDDPDEEIGRAHV